MPSHVPSYVPVSALYIFLLTAWCAGTIIWQIRLERQAQREHEPHPPIRHRLRLAKARRLVPSRPARGPLKRPSARRRERAAARH